MRFAHLSDSHLGHRQYGLLERENDFYDVFARNIDKIINIFFINFVPIKHSFVKNVYGSF